MKSTANLTNQNFYEVLRRVSEVSNIIIIELVSSRWHVEIWHDGTKAKSNHPDLLVALDDCLSKCESEALSYENLYRGL